MTLYQSGAEDSGLNPTRSHGRKQTLKHSPKTDSATDKLLKIADISGILIKLGLNETGIAKLNHESIMKLGALLGSDGQRSDLIKSMFNSISATTGDASSKQLTRLINIMHSYTGSTTILETFLTQMGERNPFIAAERAQIIILPSNESGTARGASGHILTGTAYCAYDRELPINTTGYLSGKQAITKIFEAFNPDRVNEEVSERARNRRNGALRKALRKIEFENLSLADLENSPELVKTVGSPLIARNLEVYNQLRQAIADYNSCISDLVYGSNLTIPGGGSPKVKQDPGRQFFGWFEEHFKENPNVPRGIKIAYASICDENVTLSEKEEDDYLRGLVAYQRVNSFINKQTALGGLASDLREYQSLSTNDPLRLDPKLEKARQTLQNTIASSPTELSIADFSLMLENSAMVDFRRKMNLRALVPYRDEFNKALKLFEFVSFNEGKWREDALGDSVPMERLKLHLYGAKVGVEKSWHDSEKKRATLGQQDFRHIMDAQFLSRLVSNEDNLLNAKPIAEFKAMIEGVVLAYRKALFIEARLSEYRKTLTGSALLDSDTFNKECIGDTLSDWKPVLPIGGGFKLAEEWFNKTKEPKPTLHSLGEISARMRDRRDYFFPTSGKHQLRDIYDSLKVEIEEFAPAGLYLSQMGDLWRLLDEKVTHFTPTNLNLDSVNRAARLLVHPMIAESFNIKPATLKHRYLLPQELRSIEELIEIEPAVNELCADYNQVDLGKLRERVGSRIYAMIFHGQIRNPSGTNAQPSLQQQTFKKFSGSIEIDSTSDSGVAVYFNPNLLKAALDNLDNLFISTKELGSDWVVRAKKLCSRDGRLALHAAGLSLPDDATYRAAKSLTVWDTVYVNREFAELVDRLLPN